MAWHHYHWASERALTTIALSPSIKEAGMHEVSTLDHLNVKVDALLEKLDKLTVSAVTLAPILPPCEVYGLFGYNSVECQIGSVVYKQGMRPNQNFYNQTPQNPFEQQTTLPSYANNQRVHQKSSLELSLENCLMNDSKQYEEVKYQTRFLNDSLIKFTSKVLLLTTKC